MHIMRVRRLIISSLIFLFCLLVSYCFCNSKHEGLYLTDGWISGKDFLQEVGLVSPLRRILDSSWPTIPWETAFLLNKGTKGNNHNNNAQLSSASWIVNLFSTHILHSSRWNFQRCGKTKRSKGRMLHYSNSTASFQIPLRSGDIAQNPGPARCGLGKQGSGSKQRTTRNTDRAPVTLKCDNCERTIRKNQKSVTCEICFGQHHIKCTELNVKCIGTTWTCPKCLISLLPFHNCPSLDMLDELDVPVQDTTDLISETLKEHSKHLSIMHFNTQSMVSQLPMDIITMSETWLKDNPALLDYVTLPGYTALFRNREGARGGGVGAYISDSIHYKRRKNVEMIQPDMEHLWIEIQGRNKHSKALIGVIYRSERVGLKPARLAARV